MTGSSSVQRSGEPFFTIHAPDGQLLARIHRDALAAINQQFGADSRGATVNSGVRGLLLGPPLSSPVEPVSVEGMKPVQGQPGRERNENLERLIRLWTEATVSRLSLVGFYLWLADGQTAPAEADWALMRPSSPAGSIALTIGRDRAGNTVQSAFRVQDGRLLGSWLRDGAPVPAAAVPAPAAPIVERDRPPLPEIVPVPSDWRRKAILAGGLFAMGVLAFAAARHFGWLKTPQTDAVMTSSRQAAPDDRPAPVPTTPGNPPVTSTGQPLGLEVAADRTDGYWRVSWRHDSPALESALYGGLLIEDGDQRRNAFLDAAELHQGYILYAPNSENVTLKLDVIGPNHTMASESTRILSPEPVKPPPAPGIVRLAPRVVVHEQRRLMIVVANRPPQPLLMERPDLEPGNALPGYRMPEGGSAPAAVALPGYPSQQARNNYTIERSAERRQSRTTTRTVEDSSTERHHKKHFFRRMVDIVKRPWHGQS